MSPFFQILLGLVLNLVTLSIHLMIVTLSLQTVKQNISFVREQGGVLAKMAFILFSVLILSLAVLLEAAIWAVTFVSTDAVGSFKDGVYFAIVTLTTLGYGDIAPSEDAQLLAALCAIAGLFVMGLSTAFVVEILRRLEAD
ncbi:MAG: potassium channel family protein [Pseudomonadota bacterium]